MVGDRLMLIVAALLVTALTAMTAAPPIWTPGVSPLGFGLGVLVMVLYRPDAMPVWLVALLSLLKDAAMGTPFGFSGCAILIVLWFFAARARAYQRQSPWFVWLVLAAYLALLQAVECLLGGLFGFKLSYESALFAWMMSLPFIPVLQWLVARMARANTAI